MLTNSNALLTVGGNNRTTDFYGQIREVANGLCKITKIGTGTLTLWA
jgi:hypothetical protein